MTVDSVKAQRSAVKRAKHTLPRTLLSKPLEQEEIEDLNEENKRLYVIQRNKFKAYEAKAAKMSKPEEMEFTLYDIHKMLNGTFHEEEERGKILDDLVYDAKFGEQVDFNKTVLLSREKDINEEIKLDQFE